MGEIYSGELLFGTHENLEHLALMERIVDPLPLPMLSASKTSVKEKYLTQNSSGKWRLHWPERASSASSERHVSSQRPLAEHVLKQHSSLAELVSTLLIADPARRPTASE